MLIVATQERGREEEERGAREIPSITTLLLRSRPVVRMFFTNTRYRPPAILRSNVLLIDRARDLFDVRAIPRIADRRMPPVDVNDPIFSLLRRERIKIIKKLGFSWDRFSASVRAGVG
jgi:hypothetical protein